MKLTLDGQEYTLSLDNSIQLVGYAYKQLNSEQGLKMKDGSIYKVNRTGLARTALKMLMTPIVIPFIRRLYAERGIILDPPVKHSDLIDYAFKAMLEYMEILDRRLHVDFTSETREDSSKSIKSVSTTWQETDITVPVIQDGTED